MCANYTPVTSAERLLQYFGVVRVNDEPVHDVFPSGLAPFIRMAPDGTDSGELVRTVADGIFRLVPDFVTTVEWARNTYNARTETVDTKPTYRQPWADGHRCIIPAEAIYEPNYESGHYERWRIRKASGEPMGIAGVYREYVRPNGAIEFGMSMLTVNADTHPFMRQFHEPNKEKRMVVILEPEDFEGWLTCPVEVARERYCKQWHGELVGEHMPLPQRPKKEPKPSAPKAVDPSIDMFADFADEPLDMPVPKPFKPRAKVVKKVAPNQPPEDPTYGKSGDLF